MQIPGQPHGKTLGPQGRRQNAWKVPNALPGGAPEAHLRPTGGPPEAHRRPAGRRGVSLYYRKGGVKKTATQEGSPSKN